MTFLQFLHKVSKNLSRDIDRDHRLYENILDAVIVTGRQAFADGPEKDNILTVTSDEKTWWRNEVDGWQLWHGQYTEDIMSAIMQTIDDLPIDTEIDLSRFVQVAYLMSDHGDGNIEGYPVFIDYAWEITDGPYHDLIDFAVGSNQWIKPLTD